MSAHHPKLCDCASGGSNQHHCRAYQQALLDGTVDAYKRGEEAGVVLGRRAERAERPMSGLDVEKLERAYARGRAEGYAACRDGDCTCNWVALYGGHCSLCEKHINAAKTDEAHLSAAGKEKA